MDRFDLFKEMNDYAGSDIYPFHMPGHKRRSGIKIDPYAIDITEIAGFDDLSHPEGRLRESMEWAAKVYGADRTYYLVNGSTCGILAAISAAVPFGGKIALARNAHKSAYNAVMLQHLKTAVIYPQKVDKLGIFGGISPENVDNILLSDPDIAAVLVVSPTYDGVISDIETIAQVVHSYGILLIVDEAHGAHLKFTSFYRSAIDCGADITVQSLHKTLPSLTQTALLHVKGGLTDTARLERYLHIYQSSSPSYILIGSIEECIRGSAARAPGEWNDHYRRMAAFRDSLSGLSAISLPGRETIKGLGGIYDFDDSKLIISVKDCVFRDGNVGQTPSGRWLAEVLRERFHLEMEMAADSYVLGITTPFDSAEGFERLSAALSEIDNELMRIKTPIMRRKPEWVAPAEAPLTIAEAVDAVSEVIPLEESLGHIAAEFAYLYPPGIPLVIPGERINEAVLRRLFEWREKGFPLRGLANEQAASIQVVKE